MEEKTIRISKQVNKFLDNCSESELEVCSAYYLPNIREIEEYLKQGDYNTQLAKLLSGNNPLQNHIASNQIQKEFNDLVNQGMVYELGTEDKYNSDIICNMILSLLSRFQQDNNQRDFSSRITQIVNKDIKKRVDTSVQKNKNVLEGIKDMLTTKLSKSLGLSQTEYESISNEIETLANEIYKELLSSQYISSKIVLPKEEDLKKIKNKMYNDPNYLSNILPLPKDKIISRETLAQRVIYEVMYKSASNALAIEVNKQLGYIRINGEILPVTLYDDILSFLKENSHKAFTNINMYLTSNDTVFIDEFQRQYILHLDNTHILGIEKNSKFLEFIINERTKFEEIQTKLYQGIRFEDLSTEEKIFYTSWQKKYLSPIQPVSKPNFIGCKNIVFGPKIENISPTLRIMNRLYKLSDNPPHNRPEINEQIEHVNNIQQQINVIMSSQKEDKIFERLVYFLIKDSIDPIDVIKNITKEKIKEVIDSNVCVFSNEYNINFQNNPDSVLSKVSELNKSELNRIKNKYDEIFSIQEYLNYKYKVISQSVIRYLPSFEWEKYLGGKHDTINGRLDNSKIGLFGIAQLLIENEIDEHTSSLKDGINIENPIFNLFKVADKTYYIVNFNYVTDIKKIFIVDKENGGKTYDIICEMEAFEETLMAYFEEIETNGTARFYSVQNTEDVLMKTFKDSRFGQVIDFKGNEYTTILVFAQTSDDQRITQHYTSTKGKILSVNDFIQKILSNKIELRTATSLEVSGNYEKDTRKKISDLFRHIITTEKTLSKESMNELSFIGASNAYQIIEEMNLEEIKKFIGIDNITEEEFSLIKLILKQKNLENLLKVIPAEIETMRKKANESTNGVNTAMKLNSAEAGIYIQQLQDQAQYTQNKLNELLLLQERIESMMRYNREILSRKDSKGQPIDLSSSEDIRNYIDNNIKDLNSDHIVTLHYLASCAKSIGDLKLHNYIKDICFNLYVLEEKTKFEKKYNSCVTKYEQRKLSIMATEQDALNIFDNELLPYKNKILYDIANFIDNNYLPTTEDKIRYLGLADKELSSIVRIENSRSSKTQFETEVSIDRQKQTDLFALYASDKLTILENSIYTNLYTSDISSSGKINNIVKLCEEFVKEIDSNKSRYIYDATELIDKYFFDDERTAQIENDRLIQFNDINALIASECSILNIVDILLKYLKEDLKDIYDKYVKSGVSLFESEVRDIEKMTNSRKRQSEYIEKIHNRVQIYTMTISKLYATLIKHSGKYDVGKATIISELIQEKLQETRTEIEKKTNSPVFSYGTAELTRNILSDNASPILYDLSPLDHQLRSLSESENPVTGLKM